MIEPILLDDGTPHHHPVQDVASRLCASLAVLFCLVCAQLACAQAKPAQPGLAANQITHPRLPALAEKPGWNWADENSQATRDPSLAASKAVCRRVRDHEPPAGDWPDARTAAALAKCDSQALYYGIDTRADPVRARQCALLEAQQPDVHDTQSGLGILMMIYANGRGVPRDLDLATSLACRIDAAPAEVDERVRHLQALKTASRPGSDFDLCDDNSGGRTGTACAGRNMRLGNGKRADELGRLTHNWSEDQRQAFAKLEAAANAYAQASSENEVDLSGSSHLGFVMEEETRVQNQFAELVTQYAAGKLPRKSPVAFRAADARLNAVYRQVMALPVNADGRIDSAGTVTKDGVRTVQRAWLRYRDAWLAFASPSATDSLRTLLTNQRITELKELMPAPRAVAATFHPLPADAAALLERAGAIRTGPRDVTPLLEVIFDPNAPSDAMLWRNLQNLYPHLPLSWLPVAYIQKDSAGLSATLLSAPDPAAALDMNFRNYVTKAEHGGLQAAPGKTLSQVQHDLQQAWIKWGGYTPMLIVRGADGRLQQIGGADVGVIDAALARVSQ